VLPPADSSHSIMEATHQARFSPAPTEATGVFRGLRRASRSGISGLGLEEADLTALPTTLLPSSGWQIPDPSPPSLTGEAPTAVREREQRMFDATQLALGSSGGTLEERRLMDPSQQHGAALIHTQQATGDVHIYLNSPVSPERVPPPPLPPPPAPPPPPPHAHGFPPG